MKASRGAITGWVLLGGALALAAPEQFPMGRPPGMPPQPMPTRPPVTTAPPEDDIVRQQPSFRTSVEFVEVTVVATSKNGQFARDLTREDFELFDGGVRQNISVFAKIEIAPPAALTVPPAAGAAAEPVPPSVPEDVASSSLHPDARLFVLVLDDLHVTAERTERVRSSARQFVERYTSPADLVAVVLPSGRKDMLLGFSRDRARILAVVDQFQGQKLRSATYERDLDKRFGGGSALRDGRDPSDGERAYRARVSMATLADVARLLGASQGRRKSLLYFSEGIDYNLGDVMGSVQRNASDVTHAIENALSTATRSNVAVYAIDPRGLATVESDAVEMPIHSDRQRTTLDEPGRTGELSQSIRSLRDLAEPTGGFAATDVNDFDAAFARIIRENSNYYVLGFQPSRPATGGTFRKLDVRVTKPGVTLTTRKGYLVPRKATAVTETTTAATKATAASTTTTTTTTTATTAATTEAGSTPTTTTAATAAGAGLSPALASLLASALPDPGLPIRVNAIPFKSESARTSLHVVVEVDGRDLTFASKDSRFVESLDVAMLTVDASGRAANGTQTTLALKLTEEEVARVKTTGVRWQSALELAPGHYQLRVAARAPGSARRGLAIAEIDVPDFTTPQIGMSGITLTSLPSVLLITSGRKPPLTSLTGPPTAVRQFVAGDRITAAFQVYAAPRPDALHATARVEAVRGAPRGKPLEATRRVGAGASSAQASEEVAFTFGTDPLPPGHYVLTIHVHSTVGETFAERSVPFAVVAR